MSDVSREHLALQALQVSKQSLLVHLRFLSAAFGVLKPLPRPHASFATDGTYIRFCPEEITQLYVEEPTALARNYLHVVLHNVLLHPFVGEQVDPQLWDTACDICVEQTISQLAIAAAYARRTETQELYLSRLQPPLAGSTAEAIYRDLQERHLSSEALEELHAPFLVDDHTHWHTSEIIDPTAPISRTSEDQDAQTGGLSQQAGESGTDVDMPEEAEHARKSHSSTRALPPEDIFQKEAPKQTRQTAGERFADTVNLDRSRDTWENAALELGIQLDSYVKLWGKEGSNLRMALRNVTRSRHDYRRFLERFCAMGEHIRINDDEFDYVYYCFGLSRYGNLPLIEPLEYAEDRHIRDLVIAIDTSASTKDGLVRTFIERTADILGGTGNFAADMNIHILQCDAAITDEAVIASREDLDRYLSALDIKGLGGTDFRPVFERINELILQGAFTNLCGLLYFTDGFGTYPDTAPSYPCAFVFADGEGAEVATVPAWAMKTALVDGAAHDFAPVHQT